MKVSVIIATYNRCELLKETIDSVLDQNFSDFEIILVDDGSTDNTRDMFSNYHSKVKYYKQANGGVNNARNNGLKYARGEFIAILDDDDLWLDFKLSTQVEILEKYSDVAYTYSNFSIYRSQTEIKENGIQTWYKRKKQWNTIFDLNTNIDIFRTRGLETPDTCKLYFGDIYYNSMEEYFVLPSTSLIRRSFITEDIKFIEHDPICGDWDFFARLSKGNCVAYLDYDTTYNRSHNDATRITRTVWLKQLEFRIDMIERLYLKDTTFYKTHKATADSIYKSRLNAVCRQYILENEPDRLNLAIKKLLIHFGKIDLSYIFFKAISLYPTLSSSIFFSLRKIRG